MRPITCPVCGTWLGVATNEGVEVRHRGRRFLIYDGALDCAKRDCDGRVRVTAGRIVFRLVRAG